MKKILLILCLALTVPAMTLSTGCTTQPSARTSTVQTLGIVGASADGSMKLLAQLRHDGKLTAAQWDEIAAIHAQYRTAYNLAVVAVQGDFTSIASDGLTTLVAQLAALAVKYQSQ